MEEFLLDSNINNLKKFQENYGNNKNDTFEKKNFKGHIESTTNAIRNIINGSNIKNIDEKLNQIQQIKRLCLQVDHDIFNNLINILKDYKNNKTFINSTKKRDNKKSSNNNKDEDITMQDDYNKQIYEDPRKQTYLQADKQLVKQKISEEYTNDMLGRAISKAESYSSRFGEKQIQQHFNYYNRFDNGFIKEKEDLKKSLINALDTLQDYYEMDGPNKKFPKNFDQKKIINYINELKKNCRKEDKELFDDFIIIIKGGHVDFDKFFNPNCNVDPKILVTSGISSMKFAAKQEKEWKEKALKHGDYNVDLKIDQNWDINPNIPKDLKNLNNGSYI